MSEEGITTGVEETEVAEPLEEETGVEEQDAAEPVSEETAPESGKTERDAAYAKMRREAEDAIARAEAAEKELAETRAKNEARESAFSKITGKDVDAEISMLAELADMTEDEVAEIYRQEEENKQRDLESKQKDERIQQLEDELATIYGESLMQQDLEKIRKVDPSLKSLDDLGEGYIDYISAGLDPVKAYWAVKAEERANQATPPKEIGKVETGTAEKDYFTEAEIDAMSSEELEKYYDKIIASWDRMAQRK